MAEASGFPRRSFMSDSQKNSLLKSAVQGAIAGLSAGLVYGIVEFALAVAVPRLWSNESELLPWQWPLIGMLFGVYASIGLLCGAAGGAWLARKGRTPLPGEHKDLACLILAVAFTTNLAAAWPLARSEEIALLIAIALIVAFCGALNSAVWRRRMAFLASPAILSLLLLIGPWMSREALPNNSGWAKTGASLLAIGGLLSMAALRQRIFDKKPLSKLSKATAGAIAVALLWTATLAPGTKSLGHAAPLAVPSAPEKPNILLITMDTVRADHISAYGYERDTTPYLREFAREATVYEHAIASDGFTLPTHASIFTGLYPSWHGATFQPGKRYNMPLAPRSRTLAGILRADGYWTVEAVANYGYLGPGEGLEQGFALTEANLAVHLSDAKRPFYLREAAIKLLTHAGGTAEFFQSYLRATDINRHAFALFEEARTRRRPFFMFLNYMDAHSPYFAPLPFRERFSTGGSHLSPLTTDTYAAIRDSVNAGKRVLDEKERRFLLSHYDGGIAFIDAGLKDVIKRLRELGLYDNTLVIITSDHGEAFGEHNSMAHGNGSVYQDQVHVPLLIKYPDQHQAYQSDALVSQVDLMPTVLDLAGIEIPRSLQGHSLRGSQNQQGSAVFAEGEGRSQNANPRLRGSRRAVFSGNWKLIAWSAGNPELYNLAADPGELHNLYKPGDPQAAAMMARIDEFNAAAPRRKPSQSEKPVDKQTLEKLRSLGYIQ
jgi:arylsulfatase A-like enzyme